MSTVLGALPAYSVRDLRKVYRSTGAEANSGINLQINQREIFGILGPNGAGKTTLVRQMAGLIRPTSGHISLLGQDVVARPEIVTQLASYYGQRLAGLRAFRLREVILHTAVLGGMPTGKARRAVDQLVEAFGLGPVADQLMLRLSGGQQRQALLLASLVRRLPVLILDEPTNELDPSRRRLVWDYLWRLNQQDGITIILVTHNVLEAESVVERVALINCGQIVALGTPGQLKSRVDNSIRVEVRLRPGVSGAETLDCVAGAQRLREGHYRLTAPREQADSLLREVIGRVGFADLDDFRLVTPGLEDVYLRYTSQVSGVPR